MASCASLLAPKNPLQTIRRDGITFSDSILFAGFADYYKRSRVFKNTLTLAILRSKMIEGYSTSGPAIIYLAATNPDSIDCSWIMSQLNPKELKYANKNYTRWSTCLNPDLRRINILDSIYAIKSQDINFPEYVDMHMSWFSVTGARKPVEKLIRNLAVNDNVCPCIRWPVSQYYLDDSLFALYANDEMKKYPANQNINELKKHIEEIKSAHATNN